MKNKGFTLIEALVAMLVIGIVALIAIPTVNDIVEDSKKKSLKVSAEALVKATEQECRNQQLDNESITKLYEIEDRKLNHDLEVNTLPSSGKIVLDDECNVDLAIVDNGYCAVKDGDTISVNSNTYNCTLDYVDIPETKNECFIFDSNTRTITGYHFEDASCPMNISIPTTINKIPVEHIGDFAFDNTPHEYIGYFGYSPDGKSFADVVLENLTLREIQLSNIRYFNAKTTSPQKRCYHLDGSSEEIPLTYKFTSTDDYVRCSLLGAYVEEPEITGNLTGVDLTKAIYLKSIGDGAFMDNKIETVYFGNNPNLVDFGIHTFFKNLIQGNVNLSGLVNAKSLGNSAFSRNNISSYNLPEGIEIIRGTFGYNNIETVTMPNSVKVVDSAAFAYQPVSQIQYSENLENIGDYSFAGIDFAGEIKIPDSVKILGPFSFAYNSNVTKLTLGSNVESIGEGAFTSADSLSSITFNNVLKNIDDYAFFKNNIKSLITPLSLETIGVGAFHANNMTELKLNEGLKEIKELAFYNNLITSITIPASVRTLGNGCFNANKLTGDDQFFTKLENGVSDPTILISTASTYLSLVTIPSSIKILEKYSLDNITAKKIIIPDNVTTIKAGAIQHQMYRNSKIEIMSGVKTIEADAFNCIDSYYCKYTIIVKKEKNSISGSPWGNQYATVKWEPPVVVTVTE